MTTFMLLILLLFPDGTTLQAEEYFQSEQPSLSQCATRVRDVAENLGARDATFICILRQEV